MDENSLAFVIFSETETIVSDVKNAVFLAALYLSTLMASPIDFS